MQQNRPALRRSLAEAGDLAACSLQDRLSAVPLAIAATTSLIAADRARLNGASVLIATEGQLAAARLLLDLDGWARRIVIAPPDLNLSQLGDLAQDAELDAVVTDRADVASACPADLFVIRCGTAEPLLAREADADTEWAMLTSGTTGRPKIVVHSRAALTGAIRPAPAGDDPKVWATFYDIRRYGGMQIFLRAMLGPATLVLSDAGEAPGDHLLRLARHGVTHISGTPSHWRRALMRPEHRRLRPAYVRLSGEIADQAILDSLREAYPEAAIGHAYASTEAGVVFDVTDGREGFPPSVLGRGADGEIKVVDGSLRVRSPRTANRYLGAGAPDLVDRDGFVDTDDLVESRGDRWHFVGRRSGVINVGGLKVHPEEVESVINRHDAVRMSLVKARANPITGAVVVADIVLKESGGEEVDPGRRLLKGEILRMCRAELSEHKVPVILRFIPHIAVTPAGKLARHGA